MTPTPDLARLRASHFALESLPETILVPAQPPGRSEPVAKPLVEATVDELAFALAPAEAAFKAAADRLHALRRLYRIARDAGAVGTDNAAGAALATGGETR